MGIPEDIPISWSPAKRKEISPITKLFFWAYFVS